MQQIIAWVAVSAFVLVTIGTCVWYGWAHTWGYVYKDKYGMPYLVCRECETMYVKGALHRCGTHYDMDHDHHV